MRELLKKGLSVHKISQVTGIPRSSIRRMVARLQKERPIEFDYVEAEPVVDGKEPVVEGPYATHAIKTEFLPNGTCIITGAISSLEDLWESHGLNPDEWDILYYKPNAWTGPIGNGYVVQHEQAKATLAPKKPMDPARWKAELLKEVREASPRVKKRAYPRRSNPVAMEIGIYDFHLGKLADGNETGEWYDLPRAVDIHENAINRILEKAGIFAPDIDQIIYPIGNDWGHIDSLRGETTNMTPQDCSARMCEIIKVGKDILIESIQIMSEIAPVHVISVPGNHDHLYTLFMAEILESRFWNDEGVTVDSSPSPRKYWTYGDTVLGFTHGKYEKRSDLPLLMANECQGWKPGNDQYREWHVGHLHKKEVEEYQNVRIRQIPSLCGIDAWHNLRGFKHRRAAEVMFWDRVEGDAGRFPIPIIALT